MRMEASGFGGVRRQVLRRESNLVGGRGRVRGGYQAGEVVSRIVRRETKGIGAVIRRPLRLLAHMEWHGWRRV